VLAISDDASNNHYWVHSLWSRCDFVLVHHCSTSELLGAFSVHLRHCSYLHRYGQHCWLCLSDPETRRLWTLVNCNRVDRKQPIPVYNCICFGRLSLFRIFFPDVTFTILVYFLMQYLWMHEFILSVNMGVSMMRIKEFLSHV